MTSEEMKLQRFTRVWNHVNAQIGTKVLPVNVCLPCMMIRPNEMEEIKIFIDARLPVGFESNWSGRGIIINRFTNG